MTRQPEPTASQPQVPMSRTSAGSAPPAPQVPAAPTPAGRKLLLVDDEEDLRLVLLDLLGTRGYDVSCAGDGKEALQQFRDVKPDLVILDLMLPDMSGFEICKKIKALAQAYIPVVMLTARRDIDSMVDALGGAEADDYIVKPFRPEELLARIGAALRMKDLHEVVRRQNEALSLLSMTDDLTGLYNRRFLTRKLDEQITRLRENTGDLSCVLLDLDHFKQVNDAHGHLAGDEVLRKFAQILKNSLGPDDVAGRWGGDEFLVLFMSDHEESRVREWSSRIISLLEADVQTPVGLSGGGTSIQGPNPNVDPVHLIACLDTLMYRAKDEGKNKILFSKFDSMERRSAKPRDSAPDNARKPVIFVLEDDDDICSIIRDMLSRHRISTEIFQETAQMMKSLESKTPDLIFLDMKLSDGNGMDICRELRKNPRTQKTKISFLTAFTSDDVREKAMACGADAFLIKPFTYSKFVEEVNRLLNISAGIRDAGT